MDLIKDYFVTATCFDDICGAATVQMLRGGIEDGQRGWFLEGPWGGGKGLSAKLLTMRRLCLKPNGADPCGICAGCLCVIRGWDQGGGAREDAPAGQRSEGFLKICCQSISPEQFQHHLKFDLGLDHARNPLLYSNDHWLRYTPVVIIYDELHHLDPASRDHLLIVFERRDLDATLIACAATEQRSRLEDALRDRMFYVPVLPPKVPELREWVALLCTRYNINLPVSFIPTLIDQAGGIPRRILNRLSVLSVIKDPITLDVLYDVLGIEEGDSHEQR